VIVVPPDYSRAASRAGELTCGPLYGNRLVDVLPVVGTHEEMSAQRHKMYPVPDGLFRYHTWTDVETLWLVPALK
jgi:hypothetical protein